MVRETALGTVASLLAARLNADLSDGEEPHLPCACGADARRSGRRDKTCQCKFNIDPEYTPKSDGMDAPCPTAS